MNGIEKLIEQRDAATKEIEQLKHRQKVLLSREKDAERRIRTHRLIERGAMLESVFPELTACDNKSVMAFLIAVSRLPTITELLAKVAEMSDTG